MVYTTTTSTATSALLGEYWDSELLDNVWPELQYYQFAEKKRIPGGVGKTIHFTRFERLRDQAAAPADGLQALSEASDTVLTPSYISAADITGTVVQYGHGVLFSDFLLLTSRFDLVSEALEQLGMDAGLWVDSYTVNNAIRGNGFAVRAGYDGTATGSALTSATTLTVDDIHYAGTKLGKLQAKKFRTGSYVGIGDFAQLHHIKGSIQASGGSPATWMELNKYTGDNIRELKSWMIGRIANVDVYEAHNGTSFSSTLSATISTTASNRPVGINLQSNSVDAYVFRAFGPGAYGSVDLEGGSVATFIKKLGSAGWKDLVNQRAGVGIKIFYGVKDLACSTRMVEIYSAQNGLFE